MRKIVRLFVPLLFIGVMLFANEPKGAVLTFKEPYLNFGEVYLDSMPNTEDIYIVFSNTGDSPLVISTVRACCGTRVESYPQTPVMPGRSDSICISFTLAQRTQRINRVVTINSNCSDNFSHTWRITGQVSVR